MLTPRSRALGFAVGLILGSASAASADPKAVVELFTSQGCASCRPADAMMADLAHRGDVLALAYHVDTWDYLGWRDTLALRDNAVRQRDYAEALGSRRIATPQLIVNGREDIPAGDGGSLKQALARVALPVGVTMRHNAGALEIEVGPRPRPGAAIATIRLIPLASRQRIAIERGENAGATVDYANVVLGSRPIGMWSGGAVRIVLPEDEIRGAADLFAVIVQEGRGNRPGAIVGAAVISAR